MTRDDCTYASALGAFMSRAPIAILLGLVLCAAPALAAGYDDFADGLTALARDDYDGAIALFTSALAAGDLTANLVPVAHLQRARAYLFKGNCPAATLDLSSAIALRPNYSEAIAMRG